MKRQLERSGVKIQAIVENIGIMEYRPAAKKLENGFVISNVCGNLHLGDL